MTEFQAALLVLASYLLGSVSFAALIARRFGGIDLRTVGSGNLGATNVGRTLGRRFGIAVYVLDMLKGLLPVLLVRWIDEGATLVSDALPVVVLVAIASYCGHCWPVFFGFRGGKGVATASGAVFGLSPWAALVTAAVFLVVLLAFRMMSVGSIAAGLVLPIAYLSIERRLALESPSKLAVLTLFLVLGILVVVRHRANVQRIVEGTEPKIGSRRS